MSDEHLRGLQAKNSTPSEKGSKCEQQKLSVATPAEPRGEKKLFSVQILGREKLLKFGEKCR